MDGEDFSNDDTPVLSERAQNESSVDFGDDFGVVQFADDEDATPIDSFSGIRTEQIPQVVATPAVQAPKLIQISEDTISPTPARGDARERVNLSGREGRERVNLTGGSRRIEPNNAPPPASRSTREGRITIGSDLTGEQNRPTLVPNNLQRDSSTGIARRDVTGGIVRTQPQQVRRARVNSQSDAVTGPRRRTRANSPEQSQSVEKRDIPTATAVGALLGAVYIGATLIGPVAVVTLLIVVLGLASVEFFSQTSITGYQPATIVGVWFGLKIEPTQPKKDITPAIRAQIRPMTTARNTRRLISNSRGEGYLANIRQVCQRVCYSKRSMRVLPSVFSFTRARSRNSATPSSAD